MTQICTEWLGQLYNGSDLMPTKNTQFSRSGHLEKMWRRNNTSCSRWELWRCDSPAAKTSQPWTFICSPGLANKDLMLWWSGIFKKSPCHEHISWSQWKNVLFHVETQSCRRQWWSKHFDFDDPNTQALAHLPGHPVWPPPIVTAWPNQSGRHTTIKPSFQFQI